MKLLFFTAPYCAPCKLILPTIDGLVQTYKPDFIGYDVTTTDGKEAATKYGVIVTPELVVLDDAGAVIEHYAGTEPIANNLETLLKNGGKKDNTKMYYLIGGSVLALGLAYYMLRKPKKGIGRIKTGRTSAASIQNAFITDMRKINRLEKAKTQTRSAAQKTDYSKQIRILKNKYNISK